MRGGIFSVKSCYNLLENLLFVEGGASLEEEVVFWYLWKILAPSKVLAFSWTLLVDRIPSKSNLAKCRLLEVDGSKKCIFCGLLEETATHHFLHSKVTWCVRC